MRWNSNIDSWNYHKLPLKSSFSGRMFSRLSAGNKNFGHESLPFEILLNLLTVMLGADAGETVFAIEWSVERRRKANFKLAMISDPFEWPLRAKLLRSWPKVPLDDAPENSIDMEERAGKGRAQKSEKLFMDNKAY